MNKISALVLSLALAAPMGAYAVGAIAVDDVEGDAASDVGFNIVGGYDSEKEAKAAALKECKAAGNKNCKIGVWYTKCGAYASSKTSYGYGTGATKAVASAKAIEGCDDKACKIVVADCE